MEDFDENDPSFAQYSDDPEEDKDEDANHDDDTNSTQISQST
jgi:hypothetical protein